MASPFVAFISSVTKGRPAGAPVLLVSWPPFPMAFGRFSRGQTAVSYMITRAAAEWSSIDRFGGVAACRGRARACMHAPPMTRRRFAAGPASLLSHACALF